MTTKILEACLIKTLHTVTCEDCGNEFQCSGTGHAHLCGECMETEERIVATAERLLLKYGRHDALSRADDYALGHPEGSGARQFWLAVKAHVRGMDPKTVLN